MRRRYRGAFLVGGVVVAALMTRQLATPAQPPGPARTRFVFQVVQSFDARYLGDTPGHLGRFSVAGTTPDVSLGDPVFRGEMRVGRITGLTWDRSKESLEVEFDPEPFEIDAQGRAVRPVRISVGQEVWIPMGGATAPAPLPGR